MALLGVSKNNTITGLTYLRLPGHGYWVAFQKDLEMGFLTYTRLFWSEDLGESRKVYLQWVGKVPWGKNHRYVALQIVQDR